jgi:hypothetical protein
MQYSINETSVTCVIDGEVYTIRKSHPQVKLIINAIAEGASEKDIIGLYARLTAIVRYSDGTIEVKGNNLYYEGRKVDGALTDRIINLMAEGLPFEPLLALLKRIRLNPHPECVEQLYPFLAHAHMPITPSGSIGAYTAVRNDWKDKHTGTIDNSPGAMVGMDRDEVCWDPNQGCASGYHAGSFEYANSFACGDDRIVLVLIDPADVGSVPHDCNHQKIRVCYYTVVCEWEKGLAMPGTVVDPDNPGVQIQMADWSPRPDAGLTVSGGGTCSIGPGFCSDEDDEDWDEEDTDNEGCQCLTEAVNEIKQELIGIYQASENCVTERLADLINNL